MPSKIRIVLNGPTPRSPWAHATGVRAVVFRWLARGSAGAAEALHNANQPKPLSIGPLRPDDDGSLCFEIGSLADWVEALILDGASGDGGRVRLGPDSYSVTNVEVTQRTSWEDMVEDAAPFRGAAFRMETPTAHHAGGALRRTVVAPDARLYWGSWFGRWRLCAPSPPPDGLLDLVEERMVVAEFCGETAAADFEANRIFIGYTGRVRFRLLAPDDATPTARRWLSALARLAEFSGTGVETMRGMGKTRLCES